MAVYLQTSFITVSADSAKSQSKFAAIPCNLHKAQEKSRMQVSIGFGFPSQWLIIGRESFKPITERSNLPSCNYFRQSFKNLARENWISQWHLHGGAILQRNPDGIGMLLENRRLGS